MKGHHLHSKSSVWFLIFALVQVPFFAPSMEGGGTVESDPHYEDPAGAGHDNQNGFRREPLVPGGNRVSTTHGVINPANPRLPQLPTLHKPSSDLPVVKPVVASVTGRTLTPITVPIVPLHPVERPTPAQLLAQKKIKQITDQLAVVRVDIFAAKENLQKKAFEMNVRIADFMTDGFGSETRVLAFRQLLDDLENQRADLASQLAAAKSAIIGLQKEAEAGKLAGLYASTLLTEYTQVSEILLAGVVNFYEQLAYNLSLAEQNLLDADFLYAVENGIGAKNTRWWSTKRAKIAQVVDIENFFSYIHESLEDAATGEKAENILECFNLAQAVGTLEGSFQTLQQFFKSGGPDVVESAAFKERVEEVEEKVADLAKDAAEMASCPFIAQTHAHLVSEINQFLSKVDQSEHGA